MSVDAGRNLGNGITVATTYDPSRLQPTQIQAGSLLTLGFGYGTGNNGNVRTQSITATGQPAISQTYTYDGANRIKTFGETGGTANQTYSYDAFGNRWISAGWVAYAGQTPVSNLFPNNRWAQGSGVSYDAAGNQTSIATPARSFAYDAENRQVSATINSATAAYGYDGNGLRVSKTSGGNTTVYVYDAFGYLAAEYSSQAATSACGTNTCYAILDHLGSTRMLTDASGSSTVTRYDYLPFGGELLASTNGRTTGMGYLASADGLNPKFTGKNRDQETSLDWFEVRHMSGAQGRFQSVDPGNAGAAPGNPQTWNMYSYVTNNPLSYTDPSGMGFWSTLFDGTMWIANHILPFLATGGSSQIWGGGWPGIGGGGGAAGPWSEQVPYNLGGGGSLNTGGVFGNGSEGPFVFSLQGAARWACASDFGNGHSIAAGVGAIFPEINNNAAAKFTVGLFGGNTVSGLVNLGLYAGGQKTPGPEDLAKIPLKGVGQGIPLPPGSASQARTIWSGATGFTRNRAVEAGATAAYNGIRGAGQETIQLGISNSVGSSVAGLSAKAAARAATAVGYAKVAWDLSTFGWGFLRRCGN